MRRSEGGTRSWTGSTSTPSTNAPRGAPPVRPAASRVPPSARSRPRHRSSGSGRRSCSPRWTARSKASTVSSDPKCAPSPTTSRAGSAAGSAGADASTAWGDGRSTVWGDDRTTCALVPPNPKADTAARRGPGPSGQTRAERTRTCSPTRPSGEAIGCSTPMVGGIMPSSMASTTLSRLLRPATVSRCPMLPLTEPSSGTLPCGPKNSAMDSASVASPIGVPVEWHST